ncbi:MAG: hypothetical protein R2758_02815 [Bacteroidales bacterium]
MQKRELQFMVGEKHKVADSYEGLSHVAFPPLFGHQFSHCFIDFRGLPMNI